MDPVTLWLIVGGVILVAFVLVGLVAVNRRAALGRRQKLEIPDRPGRARAGRRRPRTRRTVPTPLPRRAATRPVLELGASRAGRARAAGDRAAGGAREPAGPAASAAGRLEQPAQPRPADADQPGPDRRGHLGGVRGDPDHLRPRAWRRPPSWSTALRTRFRVEGVVRPGAGPGHPARGAGQAGRSRPWTARCSADRLEYPAVVMVVGVNGTGKTTTVGKLARVLVAEDKDVLLGAADTFRAAAADQLETWGSRVGRADRTRERGCGPGQRRVRGGQGRDRAGGRRGAGRHRRPAAHQDRPDGRAGQGEAGDRAPGPGGRGAAGAGRHHRPERADPGADLRRGGRRDRHRADQAGRLGQGRHRGAGAARARACRSSWSGSARARTTSRPFDPEVFVDALLEPAAA